MKKYERLGEYISEYSVRNKANEDIQVYSVTNTNGFCTEYFDKDVASKDQTNYKIVPKGYFAYNPSRINVGSIDCQSVEDRVIVSPLYVVFKADERVDNNYLLHYLKSDIGKKYINELASGSVRANLKFSILQEFPFPMIPIEEQKKKMAVIAKIDENIACCDSIIEKLDLAVKSRFIELFGDLRDNSKNWPVVNFCECAKIDTNMIHDFEGYENYPHIGIDSIEKDTGRLSGYRTIIEDGVISGKYWFTPEHIIYSKIRPNLNKVALPDFDGLCSADSYPILPIRGKCSREYLAHVMRSQVFLDYITKFSSRTSLPKVNKKQVEGFDLPLPPIAMQNDFSSFVKETDKSKLSVQEMKNKMEILKASVMQEYFC